MYELHFAVFMSGAILNNINTCTISILLRHSEAISLFSPNTPSPRLVLMADNLSAPSRETLLDHFLCTYEDLVDRSDKEFEWVPPSNEWDLMTTTSLGVIYRHRERRSSSRGS
ncbi:acyl-activating enzyme 6 [Pyrus ussuriensis x Pyrus communis]|uniref:Acyl-activating enzyme 6 n=1 Tax=Pyrus ussuriensis x Pyrus communis TaxID=2448454 RepID=A0A5N5G7B9_9ROSA|nr:acyl-activating enzyme 6 [Pyrus ussuriensis x Pyrus communis]